LGGLWRKSERGTLLKQTCAAQNCRSYSFGRFVGGKSERGTLLKQTCAARKSGRGTLLKQTCGRKKLRNLHAKSQ